MCGQVGVVLGTKRRRHEEIDYTAWAFTRMLEMSEERGPHATGTALVNRDGEHRLFKRPLPASEFVRDKAFGEVLADIDTSVTVLMGHTRFVTRGNAAVNENNHPLRTGNCLVTHNGTILNADYLFHRFGFERHAEVDSEIIGRIADASVVGGRIDLKLLREKLALCHGQMSAIIVAKSDPGTIIILKGNKPLELVYHPKLRAVFYASSAKYLQAPTDAGGWQHVPLKPMTICTLNCSRLAEPRRTSFDFLTQARAVQAKGVMSI